MPNSIKANRLSQLAADQKLVDGIQQFLSQMPSLPVGGQDMTPAQIAQVLEARIDKGKAAAVAADARTAAVKANRDERKATTPVVQAFKRIVLGMFLQAPDKLGVFGLVPPKKGKPTAAVKAATVVKAGATKKARGPIGKNQRKKITGVTAAASAATAPVATPAATPPPTPAPTPPTPAPTPAARAPTPVAPVRGPGGWGAEAGTDGHRLVAHTGGRRCAVRPPVPGA